MPPAASRSNVGMVIMAVEVVAVGRVDVVAQPDARGRRRSTVRSRPSQLAICARRRATRRGRHAALEPQRRRLARAPALAATARRAGGRGCPRGMTTSPPRPAPRRAPRARARGGRAPRAPGPWRSSSMSPSRTSRSTSRERARSSASQRLRAAQDVDGPARAEVQVGDDERAHRRREANLPPAMPAPPWMACSSPTSRACSPGRCATHDARRPRRRRGQGRATRAAATTRAMGPAVRRRGRRPTTSASTATSARSTLDLADAADVALARELARARRRRASRTSGPGRWSAWASATTRCARATRASSTARSARSAPARPARALPGYDLLLQAMGGLMSVTGEPDGRPLKVGAALVDMVCGLHAAIGVLAALRARERDGAASTSRSSLMDSALAALLNQGSALPDRRRRARAAGQPPPVDRPVRDVRAPPTASSRSPSATTRCSRGCARRSGAPSWPTDERFATNAARVAHRDALGAELEARLASARAASGSTRLTRGRRAGRADQRRRAGLRVGRAARARAGRRGRAACARCARRCGWAARPCGRAARAAALGEHDDELRAWLRGD